MLPYRAPGTEIVVNGKKCLNLGTFNFLGFAGNQSVKVSNVLCLYVVFVCVCVSVCVSVKFIQVLTDKSNVQWYIVLSHIVAVV